MKTFIVSLLCAVVYISAVSADADQLKTDLLVDVTKLIADAERLQQTLKNKGQLAEALALDASVLAIKEVEAQLLTLHPEDTVGQILLVAAEATLNAIEKKIAAQLKKLEDAAAGTTRRKRDAADLKTALLVDVTKLIAEAERLQQTLKDKGQLAEAIALEAAVIAVKEVETQLLNIHPEDTVGQILLVAAEATLQEVEKKLAAEVKKLETAAGASRRRRDTKSDLIAKAEALAVEAYALSAQLKGSGREKEALELEGEIAALELATTALKNVNPSSILEQAALLVAEQALKSEETKLQNKLNTLKASITL